MVIWNYTEAASKSTIACVDKENILFYVLYAWSQDTGTDKMYIFIQL